MNIYGICDNNCKHLVYTREEVLSLLQQAINDGTLQHIDPEYAAISKIVNQNSGDEISFWIGTEAQFNALDPKPATSHFIPRGGADGVVYILLDDSAVAAMPTEPMTAADVQAIIAAATLEKAEGVSF